MFSNARAQRNVHGTVCGGAGMKSERAATRVAELAVDAKRRRGAELEQKAGVALAWERSRRTEA